MSLADRYPPEPRYQVLFSLAEGVRGWLVPHWRAELYDHGGDGGAVTPTSEGHRPFPVATAYVAEYPAGLPGPMMMYVNVPDHCRKDGRAGYAARLLAACERRWPGLKYTDRLAKGGGFRGEGLEG
jgi:hypothetical protein